MQIKEKYKSAFEDAKSRVKKIDFKLKRNKDKESSEENKEVAKVSLNEKLKNVIDEYNATYTEMSDIGTRLYLERNRSIDLIKFIENLINSIANCPKSFDADINEIKINRERFIDVCEFAKKQLDVARQSAVGAGAGITAGATVASLAPSAAMWIATTFGTASTGTAISALSGAAATNATLAWLGGGALAAGGGGIATGSAFLALAGPIGWGIAGATLLSSIVLFATKKIKNDKKMKEEIEKVKINTESINEATEKIKVIFDKTSCLRDQLSENYNDCLSSFKKIFTDISEEQQLNLGTLVNNTKSLSATLEKNI